MNQNANQSKIVINNFSDFSSSIEKLQESLSRIMDLFDIEKKISEKITLYDNWVGKAQEVTKEKYIEVYECNNSIIESLSLYIKFLTITHTNYLNLEKQIDSNIESNLENLDVN